MSNCGHRVTVGMPVFNGDRFLEDAIRCVLRQTYGDFVLIIGDNASTDRTEQICQDYASRDSRIVYRRHEKNIGAANNYNHIFHMSSGEYFRWFNADDLCSSELHERCVAVLDKNEDVVLCYGKTTLIDEVENIVETYDDNLDLQQERASDRFIKFCDSVGLTNVIYGLMRRDAVARTSLMGNGSYPGADVNLMAELALLGKFIEIPEPLFCRRMHMSASSTHVEDDDIKKEFWTGHRSEFEFPTWRKNLAYLRAIRSHPIAREERWRLQRYILRCMLWERASLRDDVFDAIRRRFRA